MKYHLTYAVTPHLEGVEKDTVPADHGACTALGIEKLWERIRILREAITIAKDMIVTWPSGCGENQPQAVAVNLEAILEADQETDDIPF